MPFGLIKAKRLHHATSFDRCFIVRAKKAFKLAGTTACDLDTAPNHGTDIYYNIFIFSIQLLLQSYELVKKISKTNGVPAKEFVWALQADVECCEKIKRMFR